MQLPDWNDLRYVLAVHRGRSFAAASKALQTDPTTVSRRLRAIERVLGVRLFARGQGGRLDPTEAGEITAGRAETIEAEVGGITAALMGDGAVATGTVRVTAVPVLVNHVLVPASHRLLGRHPGLVLELVSENRDLSLTRREADVAVRLGPPGAHAGSRIVAQRVGTLRYAVYAATQAAGPGSCLPWLNYEGAMSHLPQASWTTRAIERDGRPSPLLLNDAEALMQAVLSGLGQALLPCIVADRHPGLTTLKTETAPPEREVWLLTHPDLRPLGRVATTLEWLRATLSSDAQSRSDVVG